MNRKLKKEEGITLVALIITIIILIILAAITINTVIQMNMIEKALEAAEEYEKEQKRENELINSVDKIIEEIDNKNDNEGNGEDTEEPEITKVANGPNTNGFHADNTYYVEWELNETGKEYTPIENKMSESTEPENWYDYAEGVSKWANLKTTGGGKNCYWVWIPRYAYKVPPRSSNSQTIEVKFLEGNTNFPIGEQEKITNTTPTPGNWVVHPAFTNAGNGGFGELTGIWVAKFEASNGGANKIAVVANATSWRNMSVSSIFTTCQNLKTTGNSLEGTTQIDPHMMKNTEWGAVAYLTRSIYGKNSPVWNNPYYDGTTNFATKTGLCGNTQYASQKSLTNTYQYHQDYGQNQRGANASTTGNVYGVYDMSGGAAEVVAGLQSPSNTMGTSHYFPTIYSKYYDSYAYYGDGKYGDAIYEPSMSQNNNTSWDGGTSSMVSASSPVLTRGMHAADATHASMFAFYYTSDAALFNGFRPTLVNQ